MSHPHDDAQPALRALTDIGNALGMTIPNFATNPDAVETFGQEAATLIAEGYVRRDAPDTPASPHPDAILTTEASLLDDPTVVAMLRLPFALSHVQPFGNLLEQAYGPNLQTRSMRTPGSDRFFVICRPHTPANAPDETTASEETPDARA